MHWIIDVIIVIIAIIFAWVGWKQGFIRIIFTIAGLIAGIAIAGQCYDSFGDLLSPQGATWAKPVAFAIIVIAILIVANIIGLVAKRILRFIMLGWLDKLLGPIIGLVVGALLVAAILTIVGEQGYLADVPFIEEAIGESPLAALLIDHFGLIRALLPEEVSQHLGEVF